MTQTEAKSRVRVIVDESSAGKWSDTEIYQALDAGHNSVIQARLSLQAKLRQAGMRYYEDIILKDLITLGTINTSAGTASYNTPSDYIEFAYGSYSPDGGGIFYDLNLLGYEEFRRRADNTFLVGNVTNRATYIAVRGSNLDVSPTPSATTTGGLLFYYYKQPSTVTSSQDFTLRPRAHEAIIEYALYYLFDKDNDQRAFTHLQNYINMVSNL